MSQWQPIETAPADEFVIGYDPTIDEVSCMWYCSVFERWESLNNNYPMRQCVDETNYVFVCHPTHWMPLPEPPK